MQKSSVASARIRLWRGLGQHGGTEQPHHVGGMNTPSEDAAISQNSRPLAWSGFRMVERV